MLLEIIIQIRVNFQRVEYIIINQRMVDVDIGQTKLLLAFKITALLIIQSHYIK